MSLFINIVNWFCSSIVKFFINSFLDRINLNISKKGGILLYSSIACSLQIIVKLILSLVINSCVSNGNIFFEEVKEFAIEFICISYLL